MRAELSLKYTMLTFKTLLVDLEKAEQWRRVYMQYGLITVGTNPTAVDQMSWPIHTFLFQMN